VAAPAVSMMRLAALGVMEEYRQRPERQRMSESGSTTAARCSSRPSRCQRRTRSRMHETIGSLACFSCAVVKTSPFILSANPRRSGRKICVLFVSLALCTCR
jgi:hypothetical protein